MIENPIELSDEKLYQIRNAAVEARAAILKMTTLAGSGHPGGSLSSIDFLMVLMDLARLNPDDPNWALRDRIVISCGHISPAVYSALALRGFFSLDEAVSGFRLAGSTFEGHVEPDVPGVEWASGNLGQGLSAACGFALSSRLRKINNHIFVIMGDGEQQKGQLSEARRFAIKYDLSNIIGFCDNNRLQIGGRIDKIMPQNIKGNYLSDGWKVIEIDGHDYRQIRSAIIEASAVNKPVLILAETVMGKGVSFMENTEKYHGAALKEDQLDAALKELGVENDLDHYKNLRLSYRSPSKNLIPDLTFSFKTGSRRIYNDKTDNRSAWGNAISEIAELNPKGEIAVFDCDLQGSVKTRDFEAVKPHNFFQSGIMEHHTAVCSGAMSRDGFQVFFADFGVFGIDETYNQHRLNDINRTNLKIITTHVGLDVGEDGKTHQCLDYLGVLRNLFGFKVIVPADPNQTDAVIKFLVNQPGNFLVAMGRSKLDIIKTKEDTIFFGEDYNYLYGNADLLRDGKDGAILTMGTVANQAVEAADILNNSDISLQVWNISSPLNLDEKIMSEAADTGLIITCEDHNIHTGLGSLVLEKLAAMRLSPRTMKIGVDKYCSSGRSSDLYAIYKLDASGIADRIKVFFG